MINGFRPMLSLGSPHHGLTTNDTYELGPNGSQAIATRPAGATFGPCIPIRHPQAPGKKPWQSDDNYRDWGQYIGHTRSINGVDGGGGIGWNRWLYCDPSTNATWIMRMEYTENAASVDFEIWVDGLFGRFGKQYPMAAIKLADYNWVPEIPSWNVSDTAASIVAHTAWGASVQLAIRDDGSRVYFHIYTRPGDVSGKSYIASSETGHNWGLLSGIALAEILQFDISGSNQPSGGASNLSAIITRAATYEGGIVQAYDYTAPDVSHTALLYRSPHGDVTRQWSYNRISGAFSVTMTVFGNAVTQNGTAPTPGFSSGVEVRVFAQNAVYVATYMDAGALNNFREYWVGQNYLHVADKFNDNTRTDSYVPPDTANHEMPPTRRQVCSYNLANPGQHVVATNTSLVTYTGTTYQYF